MGNANHLREEEEDDEAADGLITSLEKNGSLNRCRLEAKSCEDNIREDR